MLHSYLNKKRAHPRARSVSQPKYIIPQLNGVEPEDMGFILKGVKKRRRELGMTQLDLMAKANICGATITKAEGGGRVSYETVARIAYALGVTFEEIVKEFFGEEEEVESYEDASEC